MDADHLRTVKNREELHSYKPLNDVDLDENQKPSPRGTQQQIIWNTNIGKKREIIRSTAVKKLRNNNEVEKTKELKTKKTNTKEITVNKVKEECECNLENRLKLGAVNEVQKNCKTTVVVRRCAKKKKITTEQARKRERDNTKRRVLKYRAQLTQEQLEEKRRKDRERYKIKKENNLIKSVRELSPKMQKQKRTQWKVNSLRYRRTKKLLQKNAEASLN